jgi:hypothetical protein
MITTTTYGTWLPGDLRGYVDHGQILPGDPMLVASAQTHMLGDPVYLSVDEQRRAFDALLAAAHEFAYQLFAVTLESWHAHILLDHRADPVATAAGRLKTRIRQALDRGRLWTTGYDKRYCFTDAQIHARTQYIHRHPGHRPLPPIL